MPVVMSSMAASSMRGPDPSIMARVKNPARAAVGLPLEYLMFASAVFRGGGSRGLSPADARVVGVRVVPFRTTAGPRTAVP